MAATVMSKGTMREPDCLCFKPLAAMTPPEIRTLRLPKVRAEARSGAVVRHNGPHQPSEHRAKRRQSCPLKRRALLAEDGLNRPGAIEQGLGNTVFRAAPSPCQYPSAVLRIILRRFTRSKRWLTTIRGKLDELRKALAEGSIGRRGFLRRALTLGVSVAAAYALLGAAAGGCAAAVQTRANLDALDQQLQGQPSGKVVAPQQDAAAEASGGDVKTRIERLRARYAEERSGASRPPRTQLADDWDNWNNWENWNNWDNWGNG